MKSTTKKPATVAPPKPESFHEIVRRKEPDVFADMAALSKKHGADVFRIAGQRYFKRQREEETLRGEIAAREAELARLRAKASR